MTWFLVSVLTSLSSLVLTAAARVWETVVRRRSCLCRSSDCRSFSTPSNFCSKYTAPSGTNHTRHKTYVSFCTIYQNICTSHLSIALSLAPLRPSFPPSHTQRIRYCLACSLREWCWLSSRLVCRVSSCSCGEEKLRSCSIRSAASSSCCLATSW